MIKQPPKKLWSGDIILTRTGNPFIRWLIGKWGHVMIMNGRGFIVESRPKKGVSIIRPECYQNKKVCILRAKDNWPTIGYKASEVAIDIASKPGTVYDFPAIIRFAIPKLILRKLGIAYQGYVHDEWHICSELVWQAYYDAGFTLDCQGIPLPGDFLKCPQLKVIYEGRLGDVPSQ